MNKTIEEKLLKKVQKPGRYIGGELNSITKELKEDTVHFAFAFPDIYEVGMSHVGLKILYHLLNEQDNIYCERVFAPWIDADKIMKEESILLFSNETHTAIKNFDVIGFTLQYEMCYTNVINMLLLANIKIYSKDRDENDPIIIAGGPCTVNPEPMSDFIDMFCIGEGEEVILELVELIREYKLKKISREVLFLKAATIQGVYVPSLYDVRYKSDGTIESFKPKFEGIPKKIKKRTIKNMDNSYYPAKPIVPFIQVVHDRITQEIFRGCIRGCRFCQAGFIYRPVRDKDASTVKNQIDKSLMNTGYDEVSLVSLSTMDYEPCGDIVNYLIDKYEAKKVSVALPSLRMDGFSVDIAKKIQKVRKTGLTFAPEAGSERMRKVINKQITEDDIFKTSREVFEAGWGRLKLYFMMGLPYEEDEDIVQIIDLAHQVLDTYFEIAKEKRSKDISIAVSVSCFVPKPHTPFQWKAQNTIEKFLRKQTLLKQQRRNKKITLSMHTPELSFLEAVFALGDRRLSSVIVKAVENGCIFDGWDDVFTYHKWMDAFRIMGIDPEFYANREKSYEEILPWDFIDMGISKKFLIKENEKAERCETTPNCRAGCAGCGINKNNDLREFCR
jgi:radical SAM family uncharacterized protein